MPAVFSPSIEIANRSEDMQTPKVWGKTRIEATSRNQKSLREWLEGLKQIKKRECATVAENGISRR